MTLIVLMIVASAAIAREKLGSLEAIITALSLAYLFAIAEAVD